jgi:hypothetical protein
VRGGVGDGFMTSLHTVISLTIPVALAALILAGCNEDPPAIGVGLPTTYGGANPVFDQRVKDRFPIGSDESLLRAELAREKFAIMNVASPPPQFVGLRGSEQFPCRRRWTIGWSANNGKIAAIQGNYLTVCP